jgi:rhomboid protease GluP
MIVSAGASGAIFGVFGGLVGMLVAVRNEAPLMVLKPMARGLTAFLGYNLVFGLTVPNIDMSAHLGGLVMGIISGFVLTLSAKAPARLRPFARVLAIGGLLAVLMGAGVFATRAGVTRMRNQPEFVEYKAAPEFNAFIQSVKPLLVEFDHIQRQAGNTLADGRILPGEFSVLQSIAAASTSLNARLARVTPENADLETLKASLATMFQNQKNAIDQLLNFARTGDANHMEGQGGYLACQNAIQAAINEFQARRDQYLQKYKLTAQSK